VDEPAAETHVQAADNHDAARNSGKENELEKQQVNKWNFVLKKVDILIDLNQLYGINNHGTNHLNIRVDSLKISFFFTSIKKITFTVMSWKEVYLHQCLVRVEVNDNEIRVIGIVVAWVGRPPRVVPSVSAVLVVEGLALLRERVHTTLDVDLQPGILWNRYLAFVRQQKTCPEVLFDLGPH
jgi:hypothetical protein